MIDPGGDLRSKAHSHEDKNVTLRDMACSSGLNKQLGQLLPSALSGEGVPQSVGPFFSFLPISVAFPPSFVLAPFIPPIHRGL